MIKRIIIKSITFINRFLMLGLIPTLIGVSQSHSSDYITNLICVIPLACFQVIASLILLLFIKEMTEILLGSLIAYYLLVVFYFKLLSMNISSEVILTLIPVLLAIGLTVIIELIYKETRKGNLNTSEVID